MPHPLRFCPALPQPGKRRPQKAGAQSRPLMEMQTDRILSFSGSQSGCFYHFCHPGQPVCQSVPIYYPFSIFSIVYLFHHYQPPPAGPDARQRQPFLLGSVPLHRWPTVRGGTLGGDEIVEPGESPPTKIHLTRGLFLFSFRKINFISYCFISALIVVVFRTPKSTIFNNFRK